VSWLALDAPQIGYQSESAVLRDVQLRVAQGEALALLGGNGAGKTALLRYLAGLLPHAAGSCSVGGRRIARPSHAVAAGIGLMVQDPDDQLLATTLERDVAIGPKNLRLPPAECAARVERALRAVGLTALAAREIETLSAGERKRAALAGVLAMEPALLLLDEPTAGLDPKAERDLCETLRAQREAGRTLIVATHAIDLVPYFATRVVVLSQGRILADGPCRDILQRRELLAQAQLRQPWPVELWERALGAAHGPPTPLTMEELLAQLEAARP
jgi:cobalt/nickel transport system ATP-binding protein